MVARTGLQLENIRFAWQQDLVLSIDFFQCEPGQSVFLFGPSGSGKSSLLQLVAGLRKPQKGIVNFDGTIVSQLSESQSDSFRADHMGFIFQQFNLIPYLDGLENICLPLKFSSQKNVRVSNAREKSLALAGELGLAPRDLTKKIGKLSIGQQQRVAAARALLGEPSLIIADEPTSALDSDHRDKFLDLLLKETRKIGSSILFVSHDRSLQSKFDRAIDLTQINAVSKMGVL